MDRQEIKTAVVFVHRHHLLMLKIGGLMIADAHSGVFLAVYKGPAQDHFHLHWTSLANDSGSLNKYPSASQAKLQNRNTIVKKTTVTLKCSYIIKHK